MNEDAAAPIIVLNPNGRESRQIAEWLRCAGLGMISAVRTCDEAIFMLGRRQADLLILDEAVPPMAEQRLLRHIAANGHAQPALVRIVGEQSGDALAVGRALAAEVVRRPLDAHDIVVGVGNALQRTDLLGRMDSDRDQAAEHLATARRMQLGLLPTEADLAGLQAACHIGIAGFCRSGEAVGGDFWGAWPTGRGRVAVSVVDFAGHGLSAALNTFRLHAILSDQSLPRGFPTRMTALLNRRLNVLLPRGHYATMVYVQIDPEAQRIAWCSAGGPPGIFVSPKGALDLEGRGLPLGVDRKACYRPLRAELGEAGILCLFSDGLIESGGSAPDVPREAVAEALTGPAELAAEGDLALAAQEAVLQLKTLRDTYVCPNYSDDVMAVCVAIGTGTRAA